MIKRLLGKTFSQWCHRLIQNTKYRWLVLLGSLVYIVSPLDISPDVFPVVGWIDDGLVLTLAAAEISQMLKERQRRRSDPSRQDSADWTEASAPQPQDVSTEHWSASNTIDVEAAPVR